MSTRSKDSRSIAASASRPLPAVTAEYPSLSRNDFKADLRGADDIVFGH